MTTRADDDAAISIDRRRVLAASGAVATLAATGAAGAVLAGSRHGPGRPPSRGRVALIVDPADAIAAAPAAQWAAGQLEAALTADGYTIARHAQVSEAAAGELCILIGATPGSPESLVVAPVSISGRPALSVGGTDPRGLSYALTELADRIRADAHPALPVEHAIHERPATPVRSVMRQFTSELYDKPWFYDRAGWSAYLDTLATHRFNRVHLAFGQGYDQLRTVRDSYLLFAYPFLVSVPGYDVRATNLSDEERDRNLATLKFVSEQAVARGLQFQLGIWMHGYEYGSDHGAQYLIDGLTSRNHAAYCRDALATVLQSCPAISALSLRTHGESGVPEGSYGFWATVLDGVTRCGRTVEIDLHAKGLDTRMIDLALATGQPVNVAPKFSAEHMALPYQEASIRELEMRVPGRTGTGLMTLSEGARIFTRSSYADFLRDDRKYTVRFRVYPGTQRLLSWGDPAFAAAYARAFTFCGSTGGDVMEPLTYRGRRGTAVSDIPRTGYIDARLQPRWDWQKYLYWYRVWGRKLYDPDTPQTVFERHFGRSETGRALAVSLASASRILPLVTTAHLPSVACAIYWPEIYWNQPIAAEPRLPDYPDTPKPQTFTHASTLDPQLFANCYEFAGELLQGRRSGKYSPVEVAVWLEGFAGRAERDLPRKQGDSSIEALRAEIDIRIQAGLGRFFAAKLRAGALYALYERTGDRRPLQEALRHYRNARAHWVQVVDRARGVYADDLSVSDWWTERGSWKDRLPLLDADLAKIEERLASAQITTDARVGAATAAALDKPKRPSIPLAHTPPPGFRAAQALGLELTLPPSHDTASVTLHYRHVDQAERYQSVEMGSDRAVHRATIPAAYTNSPYPLQYYFEIQTGTQEAVLYPGLGDDLLHQPYFVLRRL